MLKNVREGIENDGLTEAEANAALDEQDTNDGLTEAEANAALDEQI